MPRTTELPYSTAQLDKMFEHYQQLEAAADAAEAARKQQAAYLIPIVKQLGDKGDKATQSFLLRAANREALATFGFTRSTRQDAVRALLAYMKDQKLLRYFRQMFESKLAFTMVDAAPAVLASARIDDRTHKTVSALFGACIDVKPQQPKLKVKAIKVAAQKKPRGGKAVK